MHASVAVGLCFALVLLSAPSAFAQDSQSGGSIPLTAPAATPNAAPDVPPAGTPAMKPAATASPAPSATSTPVATATPKPTPVSTPKPTATPVKKTASTDDLTKTCALYFPGRIQGDLRTACGSPGLKFSSAEKSLQQTRCRLAYGEEPRAVMACLIGVSISDDLNSQRTDFKRKLQLCTEQYPQHTEIDAFLQESCLTGIHLPELLPALSSEPYASCAQLSQERSFIGPCAVGLSLVKETVSSGGPNDQNLMCEKYFDHKKFHLTYRACLNARSVSVEDSKKVDDVVRDCSNIVSDPGNDNERAACLIGSNIHRALEKKQDVTKRFAKCGPNKVTYDDRDILACLTAASLVDMVGKNNADGGCRTVFKEKKGSSRQDCLSAAAQQN